MDNEMYSFEPSVVRALIRSCPRYQILYQDCRLAGLLDVAWTVLRDASEGGERVWVNDREMQANHISYMDWLSVKRICKLAERFDEDARNEGFTFRFELRPSLKDLEPPNCDCTKRGYEISDTVTIQGNRYNSNADTYATQLGIKAESMYVFWIIDAKKYGIVHEAYWCL
ncbi:hypothetical protein [Alicyclobacillus ferrooxydans]|nr:hypothetical protein [Alicyclobacillus ferrooxydans]